MIGRPITAACLELVSSQRDPGLPIMGNNPNASLIPAPHRSDIYNFIAPLYFFIIAKAFSPYNASKGLMSEDAWRKFRIPDSFGESLLFY
jgi:hypothetical protein